MICFVLFCFILFCFVLLFVCSFVSLFVLFCLFVCCCFFFLIFNFYDLFHVLTTSALRIICLKIMFPWNQVNNVNFQSTHSNIYTYRCIMCCIAYVISTHFLLLRGYYTTNLTLTCFVCYLILSTLIRKKKHAS